MKINKDKLIQICASPITNFQCEKMYSELNSEGIQKFLIYNNSNVKGPQQISFRLKESNYIILDSNKKEITSDVICEPIPHDAKLCQVYFNFDFNGNLEDTFFVQEVKTFRELPSQSLILKSNILYEDEIIQIASHFDKNASSLDITIKADKARNVIQQKYDVQLKHAYYHSYNGDDCNIRPDGSNSDGAYIFSPQEEQPNIGSVFHDVSKTFKGANIFQLSLKNDNSWMHIRYNPVMKYTLEVESVWDRMFQGNEGRNLLLHMKSDINNLVKLGDNLLPEFWTDANGMKMMRRHKDYRTGWDYNVTERVGANFFPVNYAISVREVKDSVYDANDYKKQDNNDRMITIMNDRSQSGGVMEAGSAMLIQNRFSHNDDARGVGEPIYEQNSLPYEYRIKNWVAFSNYYDHSSINSHIHEVPTIISVDAQIDDNVKAFKKSLINEIITVSECIVLDFHILDSTTVLVQAFNRDDPYFTSSNNKCSIKFSNMTKHNYSLSEMLLTGTSKKTDIQNLIGKTLNQQLRKLTGVLEYILGMQEFKLFEVKLN
jgi:hypothetical protein